MRKKKRKILKSSVFDQSSHAPGNQSDKNEFKLRLEAQNLRAVQRANVHLEKMREDDPSLLEYDSFFDTRAKKANEPAAAKSQYIEKLKKQAKTREFMYEKSMTNVYKREQVEDEKKLGKASEVFVTSAYKKHLTAMQIWEKDEKRKEKEQKSKKSDISKFYSGMLRTLTLPPKQTTIENGPEKEDGPESSTSLKQSEFSSKIPNESEIAKSTKVVKPTTESEAQLERTEDGEEEEEVIVVPKKLDETIIEAARRRAMERKMKSASS